jgi:predicted ribosome quality control (RQC) complex YloA/Tae2 family protein
MGNPAPPARGLSAAELAAACVELQALAGARVVDAAPLQEPADADDLLLVLQPPGEAARKTLLHIAPGGPRARLCPTIRRFGADAHRRGPARDLLQRELVGATLWDVVAAPGERRCELRFRTATGDRRLVVELFGTRGLWALLDAEGRAVALSRAVATAVRTLQPGDRYAPPPAAAEPREAMAARFAPPVLAAIDAHFRPLDEAAAAAADLDGLRRAAARARQKAQAKVDGIGAQLADAGRAAALREQADLMLAYAHTVARGAQAMRVPDPARDGEERTIELDPSKPVVLQSQQLYDKARRLDDGRELAEARLAAARADLAALTAVADALAPLAANAPDLAVALAPLRAGLQHLGALPKAPPPPKPAAGQKKPARDEAAGEKVRRFVSAEGYPIWVGRNNEQNDRLTMQIANGNDLWLHVGGGRPGSHVVVRLPKGKTASLETLLDAATLAVHFSKARGERRIDVVYTQKKHVRKPKGLPAGAVVPAQTKTVTVLADEARLRRLLDGGGDGAAD